LPLNGYNGALSDDKRNGTMSGPQQAGVLTSEPIAKGSTPS